MAKLIGTAFSSGTIVFGRRENPWAFRLMDSEMHRGQENRIVFDPKIAPVEIEASPNAKEEELQWLDTTRQLMLTASHVYLQRHEDLLRFRQAIHEVGDKQRLITLGTQAEIEHYTAQHWTKLSHFYASRREGFRFDIDKVVARDRDQTSDKEFDRIELHARLGPPTEGGTTQVTFDATGANVHNDIILWRKTVEDGQVGRFCQDNSRVHLVLANYKHPFTFFEEYHDDFKSRWYVFDTNIVKTHIGKLHKKA